MSHASRALRLEQGLDHAAERKFLENRGHHANQQKHCPERPAGACKRGGCGRHRNAQPLDRPEIRARKAHESECDRDERGRVAQPVRTELEKKKQLSIAQADCNENDCRVDGAHGNVQPGRRGRSPGDSEHERGGEEQAEHPTQPLELPPMLHKSRARRARRVAFGRYRGCDKGLSTARAKLRAATHAPLASGTLLACFRHSRCATPARL